MKLKIIFAMMCVQVSRSAIAQDVTITASHLPLQQVFDSLKAKTGFHFLYDPAVLEKTRPVSFEWRHASLRKVLDRCLN